MINAQTDSLVTSQNLCIFSLSLPFLLRQSTIVLRQFFTFSGLACNRIVITSDDFAILKPFVGVNERIDIKWNIKPRVIQKRKVNLHLKPFHLLVSSTSPAWVGHNGRTKKVQPTTVSIGLFLNPEHRHNASTIKRFILRRPVTWHWFIGNEIAIYIFSFWNSCRP